MRTRLIALASLALLAGVALAACGSDSEGTPPPSATAVLEVSATADVTATPAPPRQTIAGIEVGPAVRRVHPQCDGAELERGDLEDVIGSDLDLLPTARPSGAELRDHPAVTTCGGELVSIEFSYWVRGHGLLTIAAFIGEPRFPVPQGVERITTTSLGPDDPRAALIIPPEAAGARGGDDLLLLIREPYGLITVQASGLTEDELIAVGAGVQRPTQRDVPLEPLPTGIAEVDAVVAAVTSQDADALLALMGYFTITCRTLDTPGYDPTCDDLGLPVGTAYEAISVGSCDVGAYPRESVPELIASELAQDLSFNGVYVPADDTGTTPSRYTILFSRGQLPPGAGHMVFWLNEGRITLIATSCGSGLPGEFEVGRWIVEPAELGFDPLDVLGPVVEDPSRLLTTLSGTGFYTTPLPEVVTLDWLTVAGVPLTGTPVMADDARFAVFDLRSDAARAAVGTAIERPLLPAVGPEPQGARTVWVTDQIVVVLWDRDRFPAVESRITFALGAPALAEVSS